MSTTVTPVSIVKKAPTIEDRAVQDTAGNKFVVFDDDAEDDVVLGLAMKKDGEEPDVENAPGFGFTADQALALGRALIEAAVKAGAEANHAESWANSINDSYEDQDPMYFLHDWDLEEGETYDDARDRILGQAARALRAGVPVTFSGSELDLVRHLMPAHMVHQSFAARWVQETYGVEGTGMKTSK